MGISYKTYVGPYVRCAIEFKDDPRIKEACPNRKCKNYGQGWHTRGPFCEMCGSAIADMPYTERIESVHDSEIVDEINERLCSPSGDGYLRWIEEGCAHLWKPNVTTPWRKGRLEAQEDFALIDFETLSEPAQECKDFIIFFQAELAVLRKHYGEAAVSVRWGIIQDYY
jgi:hypothetical protein